MQQGCDKTLSECIADRFTQEIKRTELPVAEIARRIGEPSLQRIRDVMRGKQRLPADMLARASTIGIDTLYVITGQRTPVHNTPDEKALIDNFRASSRGEREHLETASDANAQPITMNS